MDDRDMTLREAIAEVEKDVMGIKYSSGGENHHKVNAMLNVLSAALDKARFDEQFGGWKMDEIFLITTDCINWRAACWWWAMQEPELEARGLNFDAPELPFSEEILDKIVTAYKNRNGDELEWR